MEPIIKININKIINSKEPIILELGCGEKSQTNKDNRIYIDKINFAHVDIVTDIEEGLKFFPNNSVDIIYCRSALEHINNFEFLMQEFVRVLKPKGRVHIYVPHFSNPYYYSDYTHKRFFGLYTFYYFTDKKKQLRRNVPNFYTNTRIRIHSIKLVFSSPFFTRNLIKKFFQIIFNSNKFLQEFYEENLCYIIPCYAVEIIFSPDK